MKHIFVDLEMNPINKNYSHLMNGCTNEVIEIGAVMLDENMTRVSAFKEYVKPQCNHSIIKRIVKLTGITDKIVFTADEFETVINKFFDWCCMEDEFTVYSWSGSDLRQIKREIAGKEIKISLKGEKVLSNWKDFQKMYCELAEYTYPISLEDAMCDVGYKFEGKMHDAFYDAINTAELFQLAQNPDNLFDILDCMDDFIYASGENSGFSIGSLIKIPDAAVI